MHPSVPRYFLSMLLCAATLCAADTLIVQPITPARVVTDQTPIKLELTLDAPADAARVDFIIPVPWANPARKLRINDAYQMELKPIGDDKKKFSGELTIKNYFGDGYAVSTLAAVQEGQFAFEAVVTRQGQETKLPPVSTNFSIDTGNLLCPLNGPQLTNGKFGQAMSFDGQNSLAVVPKFEFNPEKGSIELLVFQPMIQPKNENTILFLQSADIPKWSYHMLEILPATRKIRYRTYNPDSGGRSILSKSLPDENWVKVTMTFDAAANTMELFINGESQGREKYDKPCGYKQSRIELGGRFHAGSKIISPLEMLVDELRISDVIRDGNIVESAPFHTDEHTLMLLHFDTPKPFKDDSGKIKK